MSRWDKPDCNLEKPWKNCSFVVIVVIDRFGVPVAGCLASVSDVAAVECAGDFFAVGMMMIELERKVEQYSLDWD